MQCQGDAKMSEVLEGYVGLKAPKMTLFADFLGWKCRGEVSMVQARY